jgi:hypothetical protein
VTIEKKDGQRKPHPIDSPAVKVEEGRVIYDEAEDVWRILDARLKREKDGSLTVRAGQAWPVDGGAYMSHMDTCKALAEERMREQRRGKARTEEELIEQEIRDASSHIPRCAAPGCGLPMNEMLAADYAWRTHPSCDPQHRLPDLAERNRLTGRHDQRAADVTLPVEALVAAQHEAAQVLTKVRLRAAQESVDTEWQQSVLLALDTDEDGQALDSLHLPGETA